MDKTFIFLIQNFPILLQHIFLTKNLMSINNMIPKLLNTAANLFAHCAFHQFGIVDILKMEPAVTNVAENFSTNLALSIGTVWKLNQCFIEGEEFSIAVKDVCKG